MSYTFHAQYEVIHDNAVTSSQILRLKVRQI